MPNFVIRGRDKQGQAVQYTIEATSKDAVIRQVKGQGLTKIKVQERAAVKGRAKKGKQFMLFKGKVKLRDLSIFYRQFATMINAGVSLIRCLDVLEQQSSSPRLKEIIRDIGSEVESGATLSRSMQKHPRVYNNLAVGLIRAGEVGGVLDETLNRLAAFTEKDLELRRKVKAAMTYPVVVMCVAILIVVGLVTFILPKFIALFKELGMTEDQFPLPTRIMMTASNFMVARWYFVLGALVLFVMAFNRFRATRVGRRWYDIFSLRAPVFGALNHKVSVARFARTLATLLSSGVPILQALETVAGTVGNEIVSDAIMASRSSIREGETISDPLAASKMFPPMVVQMISIGEETGQLDSMLEKVAEFYEAEVDAALQSLTSALEPLLIVFLGVVVGFIAISMFLPLIGIIGQLSGE